MFAIKKHSTLREFTVKVMVVKDIAEPNQPFRNGNKYFDSLPNLSPYFTHKDKRNMCNLYIKKR